jgi:hypothetical protein
MHTMKFQEYAHHLFDAIRRGRILMGTPDDTTEMRARDELLAYLPEMEKIPLYVLRETTTETFDKTLFEYGHDRLAQGRIRLPFERMMFQFQVSGFVDPEDPAKPLPDDIWIVVATTEASMPSVRKGSNLWNEIGRGDENSFWVSLFATSINDLGEWFEPPIMVRASHGRLQSFYQHNPDNERDPLARWAENAVDAAGYVVCVLAMMESPSIELEAVKIPKQVNRGRSLLKRSRIPDHTVIRLPKIVYAHDGEHQGGTHKRPRCHWRRPHRREYKPGEWADIPLTLVARREGEPLPPPPVVEIITHRKEHT